MTEANNYMFELLERGQELTKLVCKLSKFLFSRTQKVNDPCGQHIYIQEQCSTFDIDKDK